MAFLLSTGLRNSLLGEEDYISSTGIAAVEDGGTFSMTGASTELYDAGFAPGDIITIAGFTGTGANNQITTVTSNIASGQALIIAGTMVDDAAGETVTVTGKGKSFLDIFNRHVIRIYSGSAPSTADAVETGTLLVTLTVSAGAFVAGLPANGLRFLESGISAGVLGKNTDTHSGTAAATGTAGYYRMYNNLFVTGASTSSRRVQGTVGTSGAQFILSSTSIVSGATVTLDTHNITLPAS